LSAFALLGRVIRRAEDVHPELREASGRCAAAPFSGRLDAATLSARSPHHGNPDLPAWVAAEKTLVTPPAWVEVRPNVLRITTSLEDDDGVTLEGLMLRGTGIKPMHDRQVMFQLEYRGWHYRAAPSAV